MEVGYKVDIPFLERFREPILSGQKNMTSRTKRLGGVGDWFEVFGRCFVITRVKKLPLDLIASCYYWEEGCESEADFKKVWRKIHPRIGFRPDQEVFCHFFYSHYYLKRLPPFL